MTHHTYVDPLSMATLSICDINRQVRRKRDGEISSARGRTYQEFHLVSWKCALVPQRSRKFVPAERDRFCVHPVRVIEELACTIGDCLLALQHIQRRPAWRRLLTHKTPSRSMSPRAPLRSRMVSATYRDSTLCSETMNLMIDEG